MSPYTQHTHEEPLHHSLRVCDGVMGSGKNKRKRKRKKKVWGMKTVSTTSIRISVLVQLHSTAFLLILIYFFCPPLHPCILSVSFFLDSFSSFVVSAGNYRQTLWMASVCKWYTPSSIQKLSARKPSIISLP
ncbi:hypothetical protein LI328DRAFT_81183 [Trichoderma asperelloides]|nr:hypothetical protein LI328DRAFT_81183 [Trichoderma asperelloides]